ncbi:single-stranded DNA-binding protein [Candidatus Pacearchaeota archaeon]|nr:single-stranded DNA-binding protein [Candidatus Pacearchaeota archaeon]
MINQINLSGKIIGDKIRSGHSKQGTVFVNFRIMNKHPKAEAAIFKDVEAWGAEAERAIEYLEVGDYVTVYGEIRVSKWQDDDGEDRYHEKIIAHRIIKMANVKKG